MEAFQEKLFSIYIKYVIEISNNNDDEYLSKMIDWFEKELHNIIYNEFIDYKYSIDIALKNNLKLSKVLIRKFIDVYKSFKDFKIKIKRRYLNVVVIPEFVISDTVIYSIFIKYLDENYLGVKYVIDEIIIKK